MPRGAFIFAAVAAIALSLTTTSYAAAGLAKDAELTALSFHKAISNYSAATADEMLLKSRQFFVDEAAYLDFRKAVRSSGNYDAVKKFDMTVTSAPGAANASKSKDGAWTVTFRSKDSYRPVAGAGLDQCLVVSVVLKSVGKSFGVSSIAETTCPAGAK
jgi:chitodextrinase